MEKLDFKSLLIGILLTICIFFTFLLTQNYFSSKKDEGKMRYQITNMGQGGVCIIDSFTGSFVEILAPAAGANSYHVSFSGKRVRGYLKVK